MSTEFFNPETILKPIGYNHGVLMTGARTLFIAGQVGLGSLGDRCAAGDFCAQFSRALASIRMIVEQAGGTVEHIGRLTIFVKNMRDYLECRGELRAIYREHFGRHFPAMSLVQVGAFVHPEIEVEIEATAILP